MVVANKFLGEQKSIMRFIEKEREEEIKRDLTVAEPPKIPLVEEL